MQHFTEAGERRGEIFGWREDRFGIAEHNARSAVEKRNGYGVREVQFSPAGTSPKVPHHEAGSRTEEDRGRIGVVPDLPTAIHIASSCEFEAQHGPFISKYLGASRRCRRLSMPRKSRSP